MKPFTAAYPIKPDMVRRYGWLFTEFGTVASAMASIADANMIIVVSSGTGAYATMPE